MYWRAGWSGAILPDYVKINSMHKRAYFFDSYTVQFEANVAERLQINDQPVVILDKTYFYPTSGGQPCDKGNLDECDVVDVQLQPEDGAILHFLDSKLEKEQIKWFTETDVSVAEDKELLGLMRDRGLATPVLLSSGYGEDCLPDTQAHPNVRGFLAKPYPVAKLSARVRELLGSA